jgi:alcohol dehydrogenase class IV
VIPFSTFRFALDTEILFGVGTRRDLGGVVARWGSRAGLVTGSRSFDEAPWAPDIAASLKSAGIDVVARIVSRGEPDTDDVDSGATALRSARAEVVIAVGGGSALDLAKAAAIVATSDTPTETLLGGSSIDEPIGLPVIAAPTTGGTGSEVSRGAIILDRRAGRKRGVRGRGVASRAAVVDPELCLTANHQTTAEAGVDAIAHAIETALSRAASPLSHALSADALARLYVAVPASLVEPSEIRYREQSSYAALLMGINLATSTTCLPHRLQYPIGALTGTRHAQGVAALLLPWLKRTCRVAPGPLGRLGRDAGVGERTASDEAAAAQLTDAVGRTVEQLVGRIRLRDLGVERSDLLRIVEATEGTLTNDPGPVDQASLLALCEAAW